MNGCGDRGNQYTGGKVSLDTLAKVEKQRARSMLDVPTANSAAALSMSIKTPIGVFSGLPCFVVTIRAAIKARWDVLYWPSAVMFSSMAYSSGQGLNARGQHQSRFSQWHARGGFRPCHCESALY